MRNPMLHRLRVIEAKHGQSLNRSPVDMTDDELWRAVDVCDPVTGEVRMDLTDAELEAIMRSRASEGAHA